MLEQSRGFGFITVPNQAKADEILSSQPHTIKGEKIECKKAFPKEYNSVEYQGIIEALEIKVNSEQIV